MEDEKTIDTSVNDVELNEEETSDEKTGDTDDTVENDNSESEQTEDKETDKEDIPDYRPRPETKKKPDNVPFSVFLAEKKKRQEAERRLKEQDKTGDNKDEYGADETDTEDLVERKVKEIVSPLMEKQLKAENVKHFEADFERNIASKFPDLKGKKDQFMEIAFNPSLVDKYPTLDSIRQAFWADAKPANVKKTKTEGGSQGTNKGTERVDFAKLGSNPELYRKVMADPEQKKKYFAYLDSQGL